MDNVARIRDLFRAWLERDALAVARVIGDGVVWRVPGGSAMAGVYRGPEAIFRFLGRLPKETGGTYRSQLVDVLASDERAAALYRASGARRGRTLDLDQVLLFRLEDGAVRDVLALPSDPAAFEEFWAR